MRIVFRCDPALYDRLPRPVLARSALPEWLRRMPAAAFSETHGQEVRTVKQCPPFVDAMAYGFIMPLACDVAVRDAAEGVVAQAQRAAICRFRRRHVAGLLQADPEIDRGFRQPRPQLQRRARLRPADRFGEAAGAPGVAHGTQSRHGGQPSTISAISA
ncbi:MAG: hypothetical protein ACLQJR_28340 [Stellaceae bacterium]